DVGLVDPAVGRGQRHQERGLRPLEPEADALRIRRLHHLDRAVLPFPVRRRLRRRKDDLVVAGLDVPRGHDAAVVQAHALPPPERGLSCAEAGDSTENPTSSAAIRAARTLVFISLSPRPCRYSASQTVSSCWFRKCDGVIVQPRTLALCATMRCHCSVYR